ncbi:purine-nucleoside phosphorylase [Leucobacter sp. CSA1]|uniref:Purine-nucleoside phosphorylase n=1 Tax=Leucobacter chromiisoli TaxID=2796471 RepID=A0A934Q6M1_9MICO|nr:purine-nucleoside phosphorylase [Leucobacter chromiisoli]MBK0418345.1 purine-nucleoside phosphorylase [Leucobacter chromiisoli]
MTAEKTLLVFAHADEATAFGDVPHVLTGVGKVNAATSLASELAAGGVERVVVLGTAGVVAAGPRLDTVYQITRAVQHDFSLPSRELCLGGPVLLDEDRTLAIATGDLFVQDDAQRARIAALGASLVDMETYAYASVCERFGVPLQVFKVPSDFADSSTTAEEWDTVVFSKSDQLRAFCAAALPELLP